MEKDIRRCFLDSRYTEPSLLHYAGHEIPPCILQDAFLSASGPGKLLVWTERGDRGLCKRDGPLPPLRPEAVVRLFGRGRLEVLDNSGKGMIFRVVIPKNKI